MSSVMSTSSGASGSNIRPATTTGSPSAVGKRRRPSPTPRPDLVRELRTRVPEREDGADAGGVDAGDGGDPVALGEREVRRGAPAGVEVEVTVGPHVATVRSAAPTDCSKRSIEVAPRRTAAQPASTRPPATPASTASTSVVRQAPRRVAAAYIHAARTAGSMPGPLAR